MKTKQMISVLFSLAAVYDGVLGLAFLVAPSMIFQRFEVAPPNHFGYVQFSALLLLIFAVMFASVAYAPDKNRNLIPYGIALKIAYCGIVFYYWFSVQIPTIWKPFAVLDFCCIILFTIAFIALKGRISRRQ
ncbi:MAG: hypothetical protein B6I25_02405 [Planctomycetales bacterium 4572_13]|nr:MAG: hypothetical protein B6I25_02405 [Planctomycetales bacterium 4572_13]